MLKLWQLQDILYSMTKKEGYNICNTYSVWNEYGYEKDGKLLKVVLKWNYYKSWKIWQIKKSILNKTFSNLTKNLEVEIIKPPVFKELGYINSIEMLYNYYPYGENNNTNCVFINHGWQILAVQYNWLANTSFIVTDVWNIPDYIILNNSKKLSWEYYKEDYNKMENWLNNLFFNKEELWN